MRGYRPAQPACPSTVLSFFEGAFTSDVEYGEKQFAANPTTVIHIASLQDRFVGAFHYWTTNRRVLPSINEHFKKSGYANIWDTLFSNSKNWTARYGNMVPVMADEIHYSPPTKLYEDAAT